jgi:hypothetical protein
MNKKRETIGSGIQQEVGRGRSRIERKKKYIYIYIYTELSQ